MSRYLIDSHVFLWLDSMNDRLRPEHVRLLADPVHEVYLSAASIWELSIKRSLQRLEFAKPFGEAARSKGLAILPVTAEHAEAVERLPRLHTDPFDHLLVVQAQVEGLILVTHDAKLHAYNVPMLRV